MSGRLNEAEGSQNSRTTTSSSCRPSFSWETVHFSAQTMLPSIDVVQLCEREGCV